MNLFNALNYAFNSLNIKSVIYVKYIYVTQNFYEINAVFWKFLSKNLEKRIRFHKIMKQHNWFQNG